MAIFQVRRFVFSVYVFVCFVLVELYRLVVKAVCKLAYKQVLVAFCTWRTALTWQFERKE